MGSYVSTHSVLAARGRQSKRDRSRTCRAATIIAGSSRSCRSSDKETSTIISISRRASTNPPMTQWPRSRSATLLCPTSTFVPDDINYAGCHNDIECGDRYEQQWRALPEQPCRLQRDHWTGRRRRFCSARYREGRRWDGSRERASTLRNTGVAMNERDSRRRTMSMLGPAASSVGRDVLFEVIGIARRGWLVAGRGARRFRELPWRNVQLSLLRRLGPIGEKLGRLARLPPSGQPRRWRTDQRRCVLKRVPAAAWRIA